MTIHSQWRVATPPLKETKTEKASFAYGSAIDRATHSTVVIVLQCNARWGEDVLWRTMRYYRITAASISLVQAIEHFPVRRTSVKADPMLERSKAG